MYVCVDCVLLKVVTTHVNVDTHVDFVVVYVWNSFEGGTKTILTTNATHAYCILSLSPLSSARSIMTDKKPRKPNWSEGEMCVLADACLSFNQIIRGKFSPSLTSEMKKKAWETITDKVNSVAINCTRTLDETKKRFQDAQSAIKKKEAFRKRETNKTGGGPPPEVNFKPWELTILSTIPSVAIHGLDGGADTGTDLDRGIQTPGAMGDTCSWTLSSDQVTDCIVDIIPENECSEPPSPSPSCTLTCTSNKNKNRSSLVLKQKAGDYENGMKEIIAMKKKRLELEERKVKALERIASALEGHQGQSCTEFSVSPIIKFN
eukprot:XP_019924298.1 PREDICTED: uncharacterized protein LOC105331836 isoform X2 [Crassostrea gigas]